MLLLDNRAGSKELYLPLQQAGLNVSLTQLSFGDCAFVGQGPDHRSLDIGIEYKQLGELVTSIRDGRFAGHQLPGMRKMFDHSWLVVEGEWRAGPQGQMLQKARHGFVERPGGMPVSEYQKHLFTFELCANVHIQSTSNQAQTVHFIEQCYRWWTDKPFHKHTSHLAVHDPRPLFETSRFRQAVQKWPHVGPEWSRAVEKKFGPSVRRAGAGTVEEWAQLEIVSKGKSKRLGVKKAKEIVAFCVRGDWP